MSDVGRAVTEDQPVGWPAYPHEVLAAVLSVRAGELAVLLWRRDRPPYRGRWSLPGGGVQADERLRHAISRHLADKVDVHEISHLEQLATHSAVRRDPRARVLATAYLALVRADASPELPADTAWQSVSALPPTAFDHHFFVEAAIARLRGKLSYTNIGFALAPRTFTIAELRAIYGPVLGYVPSATNLVRVLTRRGMIEPTGSTEPSGRTGGRPGAVYRFVNQELTVTDPFAVLKPQTSPS